MTDAFFIFRLVHSGYQLQTLIVGSNHMHAGSSTVVQRIVFPGVGIKSSGQINVRDENALSRTVMVPSLSVDCFQNIVFRIIHIIGNLERCRIRRPAHNRSRLVQLYRFGPSHTPFLQSTITHRQVTAAVITAVIHQRPGAHIKLGQDAAVGAIEVRQSQLMTEFMAERAKAVQLIIQQFITAGISMKSHSVSLRRVIHKYRGLRPDQRHVLRMGMPSFTGKDHIRCVHHSVPIAVIDRPVGHNTLF